VRSLLACLLVTLGLAALGTRAAARTSVATAGFACTWSYSLYDGLRANFVTAGNNATCVGQRGSLTLSTRLQEWDVSTHKWRTTQFRHRTWTNLNMRRFTEVARRCDGGRYRAKFTWLLRRDGSVVSHLALRKGPIAAPIGCRIRLG
jgi:hypothetical protein